MSAGIRSRGARFLRVRWRVVLRLACWSVLETGQTFLTGYAPARALDEGFLAGRAGVGLAWLAVAGIGVLLGAYGTARVYAAVAALVEPLRDRLVERVVRRGVREADRGALSGLTQQVEIARDTFAGLVLVSRSFVFTAVGALVGLFSLAPLLLLVVGPPLLAGVALFAATLRPLARRQEAFLVADEALAEQLGAVCPGLRDVTATGAEERIAEDCGCLVDTEFGAARSLARWSVLRVASLAVGGQLPIVLLLAASPWLLARGVTTGALVGALAYVTQSLLPALHNLVHGLGTSGSRLTVVLRRLTSAWAEDAEGDEGAAEHAELNAGHVRWPTARGEEAARAVELSARQGEPSARHEEAATRDGEQDAHRTGLAARQGDAPAHHANAAVSLSGVTFAYGPASAPVVEEFDLVLAAGSHLAVVGPSGIGKSTLTGLVAGLLRPVKGQIEVYGEPVPSSAAAARRVLIPQEAYVFSGTVAENLGHFRADPVPEAELLAAADAVGMGPLLERLGGPGAVVDPATLSGGERQLVALTRAYLSYAPLALLDEATCHLDPRAEERAERAFAARPGGTLVVVAHRISSARRSDRVLVMDGTGTAFGTHDELLDVSPLYRDLVGGWTPAPARRSEPALALRDADGVDAVARPGLAGDGRHVVAHRPVGQVQASGDLGDGGSLRRQR
ncbi:ATP-binding cassette domain-containing protein [Streptomyces sp. SLBN-31]|uniref:ATP-binding cassette domain-containing protein n=1 Tax=Streptomyces sp. SLBN-31 TaxID=2768444 RepID=UPI00116F6407|nr:ATP-binding cassette domain-containing protein [Streptomyces sp. SLBN-31]TQJ91929.1 ATP-binding cassette subfamily C protein [Streptomyces sp. SLBN-31]